MESLFNENVLNPYNWGHPEKIILGLNDLWTNLEKYVKMYCQQIWRSPLVDW